MEPRGTHKPKLLIIDDEPQIRRLLVDLLDGSYDCCDASSAEEALNALSEQTFDLVLSDIDMGGMSGLELVPRVHALSPDTVVVMISGNQDIDFAIRAMRAGAFDYIPKFPSISRPLIRLEDIQDLGIYTCHQSSIILVQGLNHNLSEQRDVLRACAKGRKEDLKYAQSVEDVVP